MMNGNADDNEAEDVMDMDEGVDLGVGDDADDDVIDGMEMEEAEGYEVEEGEEDVSLEGLISNTVTNSLREKQEEFREDLDNLRREVDQETKKLEEAEMEMDHWLSKLQNQSGNIEENPQPQPEPQYPGLSPSQTNQASVTATARAEKTEAGAKVGVEKRKRRRPRLPQPRSYTPPPPRRGPASADQAPFDHLIREKPVLGDKYWARKDSSSGQIEAWELSNLLSYSCQEQIKEERGKPPVKVVSHTFKVELEDSEETKDLTGKDVARDTVPTVRLAVGTRVIAIYQEEGSEEQGDFYPGVVGETPKLANDNRYLVFFDDTYPNYVTQDNLRLVYQADQDVWKDVWKDETNGNDLTEFLPCYLKHYPHRPMIKLKEGDKIRMATVKMKKKEIWVEAEINWVDCSLAQVTFEDSRDVKDPIKCELIYRGSPRFELMKRQLSIMANQKPEESQERRVRPRREQVAPVKTSLMESQEFVLHDCGPDCEKQYEFVAERHRGSNPLRIPLHLGWRRKYVLFAERQDAVVSYTAPCGRNLRNIEEVQAFLQHVKSKLEIDFFAFDPWLDVMRQFIPKPDFIQIRDISFGKEKIQVPAANSYDSHLPNTIQYSTVPVPQNNVHIETDPGFLVKCDCDGLCDKMVEGKFVCPCRQLTVNSTKDPSGLDSEAGYRHRRLQYGLSSGIYECNQQCSCSSTCSNRLVQFSIRRRLQVFKTKNNGWGLRALDDIPQGAFICTYAGNLYTDQEGDERGATFGDTYFADLDLIEQAEAEKEEFNVNPDLDEGFEEEKKQAETAVGEETKPVEGSEEKEKINPEKGENKKINPKKEEKPAKGAKNKKGNDKVEIKSARNYFKNEKGEEETGPYVMDANSQGNIGRYFNHSCDPNIFVQNVFIDSHDLRFHNIAFFAMKFVKAGDELCWDYGYQIDTVTDKKMTCNCGAQNCKGRLL